MANDVLLVGKTCSDDAAINEIFILGVSVGFRCFGEGPGGQAWGSRTLSVVSTLARFSRNSLTNLTQCRREIIA